MNAELIKALRICDADEEDGHCYENECPRFGIESQWSDMNCDRKLMRDAADALEAAEAWEKAWTQKCERLEKRIAELEKSYSWKAYAALEERIEGYKVRIAELEAQMPKEGEWIPNSPFTGNCSECGGKGNLKDKYCPNCGAKMRGEHDGSH